MFSSRRAQAGHAPQEFAPPPVNPAAAAAAAAKASRAPKPASLYGRAPARAPEANVQALNTVKRDRRTVEEAQKEMRTTKLPRTDDGDAE